MDVPSRVQVYLFVQVAEYTPVRNVERDGQYVGPIFLVAHGSEK